MSSALWGNRVAFTSTTTSSFFGLTRRALRVCPVTSRVSQLSSRRLATASIEQEVSQQMKAAMKAKDTDTLKALRGIRAAFLTASKEAGAGDSLSDEVAVAQLRKLAKMRKESIVMFQKGGRDDLAEAEEKELAVIEQWLPKLADAEQTTLWAKEAIEKVGASKKGDMGKVMGVIMKEHKQEVDGALLKEIVNGLLV